MRDLIYLYISIMERNDNGVESSIYYTLGFQFAIYPSVLLNVFSVFLCLFCHFLSPLVEKLAKSRVNEVFSSGQMQSSPIHAIFDPF